MVMRSNPYYNSHILAQVGNNLASAIYGDPDYKFKQEANDRANLQTQMAVSQHQQATAAAQRQAAAREGLAAALGAEDYDPHSAFRDYVGAGGDVSLGDLFTMMLNEDPRHVQKGDLIDREHGNRVELQDDQQDFLGGVYDQRNLAGIVEALIRADASKSSGSSRPPMDVSAADLNHLNQMLNGRLEELAGSGYEIDPELKHQLQSEAASRYQSSRNAGAALSDVLGMLDIQPEDEGGWFGIGSEPGSVTLKDVLQPPVDPTAPAQAAPQVDPAALVADAQAAIAKGADPAAVAQRLRDMGIDPAAAGL